jgi:hypothetical protein
MERIVLEVDDRTAKAWKLASSQKRKTLSAKLDAAINETLTKDADIDFVSYLNELRDKMEMRGLTQEALNDILKDE